MRPPKIRDEGGVLVIRLDDASALNDGHTVGLRQALFQALPAGGEIRAAVDLGAIEFLSSSGVALLIGLKRRLADRGGRLVLFGVDPNVLEQLRTMKLSDFFGFAADLPHAIELLPSTSSD